MFEATEADLAAVPKTPDAAQPANPRRTFAIQAIKADRELVRDPAYMADFVNVPLRVEEVAVALSRRRGGDAGSRCGCRSMATDDGAALRDILFTWWEQRFLGAAESGAPAIGDR